MQQDNIYMIMKLIKENKWFSLYKEYKKLNIKLIPKVFKYSNQLSVFDYFILNDYDDLELILLFMHAYKKYLRINGREY